MKTGQKREAYFDSWKVGSENLGGKKILSCFHRKEGEFLIYESEDSSLVSFNTHPESTYSENLVKIEKELSLIRGLLTKYKHRKRFLPRIAASIKCLFYGDEKIAISILKDVIFSIEKFKVRVGRLEYLAGTIIFGLSAIIIATFFNGDEFSSSDFELQRIILFSALGGFLSISTNLKNIEIEKETGTTSIHIITGMSRIFISLISGFIAFHLIESGLIFDSLVNNVDTSTSTENAKSTVYVLIAISGFSERLIPNILEKFTNKSETNNK